MSFLFLFLAVSQSAPTNQITSPTFEPIQTPTYLISEQPSTIPTSAPTTFDLSTAAGFFRYLGSFSTPVKVAIGIGVFTAVVIIVCSICCIYRCCRGNERNFLDYIYYVWMWFFVERIILKYSRLSIFSGDDDDDDGRLFGEKGRNKQLLKKLQIYDIPEVYVSFVKMVSLFWLSFLFSSIFYVCLFFNNFNLL